VSVFEGNEAGSADTCDGFVAGYATLRKEVAEAFGAVRFIVARCEALAGERSVAVGTGEAFAMPWLVLVSHAARRDDLVTLDAAGCELLLVAASAVDLLVPRDERLGANRGLADDAAEAFFMPLAGLVFHLLVTCSEDLGAAVATRRKLRIVAGATVDLLHLAAELLVHQRD